MVPISPPTPFSLTWPILSRQRYFLRLPSESWSTSCLPFCLLPRCVFLFSFASLLRCLYYVYASAIEDSQCCGKEILKWQPLGFLRDGLDVIKTARNKHKTMCPVWLSQMKGVIFWFLFLIPLNIGDSILEFYAEFNSLFMVKIFLLAHTIIWVLKKFNFWPVIRIWRRWD